MGATSIGCETRRVDQLRNKFKLLNSLCKRRYVRPPDDVN